MRRSNPRKGNNSCFFQKYFMITVSEKADSLKGHCCSGIKEDAYPFKGQCHEHDLRSDL
jgi:hypothetical protein